MKPEHCFAVIAIPGMLIAGFVTENRTGYLRLLDAPFWTTADGERARAFVRELNDALGVSPARASLIIDSAKQPLPAVVHAVRRRTWDRTEAAIETVRLRAQAVLS